MQANERTWHRILGRLHRRASLTLDSIMQATRNSPRYQRSLSPGVDVYPGMDRDPAPTDPDVYNRPQPESTSTPRVEQRQDPCDHYARPIDIRHLNPGQILMMPLVIPEDALPSPHSPVMQELEEILHDLEEPPAENNEENRGASETETQAQREEQRTPPEDDLVYDYVTMQPLTAAATAAQENRQRSSRPAQPLPTSSSEQREQPEIREADAPASSSHYTPPLADMPPIHTYGNLPQPQPQPRQCEAGMIHAPIPQRSPPIPRQRHVRFPPYYRDYANILAMPSYSLICHSAWYAQASINHDVVMCLDCANAEHLFCALNRPQAAWRHIHVLARNFYHTTMHCGRCYKLILRTKRAIDCSQCRLYVIQHHREIERIIYKVMCDTTVPYPYSN